MLEKKNKVYLELIRVVAIVLVIFNHTGANGSTLYTFYSSAQFKYWFWLFIANFSSVNVPLFFMVSGALLLGKSEDIRDILSKRVGRVFLALLLISIFYYFCVRIGSGKLNVSIKDFVQLFYTGKLEIVYWFLYAYIGFLLTLPFLRPIAQSLNATKFIYLTIITISYVTIIPLFEYFVLQNKLHITEYLDARWLTLTAVVCPLAGYYLDNIFDINKIRSKHIGMLLAVVFVCGLVNSYLCYLSELPSGQYKGTFRTSFFFIYTLITFICLKWAYLHSNFLQKYSGLVVQLGASTFGIYMFHILVLRFLNRFGVWGYLHKWFHKSLSVVFYIIIVALFSMVITYVVKRLPLGRKLL